jgi:hypothetical protein
MEEDKESEQAGSLVCVRGVACQRGRRRDDDDAF